MQFNLNFAKIETKIKIYSNYGTGSNTFVWLILFHLEIDWFWFEEGAIIFNKQSLQTPYWPTFY